MSGFSSALVNPSAIASDLSLSPGERLQVPHLDHRSLKIVSKCKRVHAIKLHQLVTFTANPLVEFLIRVKETLFAEQFLEVRSVNICRGWVQWSQVIITTNSRACSAQRGCKGRVNVGVVVDAVSEVSTPCKPYGVATRECHQVLQVHPVRIETAEKLREAEKWSRKVCVCSILACSSSISSA